MCTIGTSVILRCANLSHHTSYHTWTGSLVEIFYIIFQYVTKHVARVTLWHTSCEYSKRFAEEANVPEGFMRNTLVILMSLSLVLFAACSQETNTEQGDQTDMGEMTTRIVGGSSYDGLPAVGTLLYSGSTHCTGTLIAPRKVLTAAHCVDGFSASKMRFAIGPNAYSPQTTIQASSIEAHPGYNAYNISNDIGLVHLAQDAPVEPMPIVTSMDSSWVGRSLFFVGYGVDNGYNQTGAGIKRAVWMAISSVDSTTFRYDDPNRNTCNGDSGGPAFTQDANGTYFVAGVTSYGDAYCTQYGVDTRVDAYLDFIDLEDDPIQQDPCQGESWEGRCQADSVIWCENDQIYTQDCAADGKVCIFAAAQGYYACVEPEPEPEPEDPCLGESFDGRCDGQTVVWCENEQVHTQNCQTEGKECVFDADKSYYACREPAPVDPCNGETWAGRCENGSVIWCENDQISSIDCQAKGGDCGYNSQKGYYDCM